MDRSSNRRTRAQAAEWAVRSHGRDLSSAEQAELDEWLGANPRHRGAWLRASAAWIDLDRLAAMAGTRGSSESLEHRASRWWPEQPLRRLSGARSWVIAAGVAAVLLGAVPAWLSHRHQNVFVSEVGQV